MWPAWAHWDRVDHFGIPLCIHAWLSQTHTNAFKLTLCTNIWGEKHCDEDKWQIASGSLLFWLNSFKFCAHLQWKWSNVPVNTASTHLVKRRHISVYNPRACHKIYTISMPLTSLRALWTMLQVSENLKFIGYFIHWIKKSCRMLSLKRLVVTVNLTTTLKRRYLSFYNLLDGPVVQKLIHLN